MSRSLQSVVPQDEVRFHPHSFGDPDGRLFRWKGELYRGLRAEKSPFYSRLFKDGVIQRLADRGLFVKSEATDLALDGYALVIHHQTIPFPSYPNEWCAAMFQDAVLAVLDLGLELARENLTLKDHHLWNLVFDGGRPVYVDLTSIIPIENGSPWPNYGKFCRSCLYPLLLMAGGYERIARHLLPDYEGVQLAETAALMSEAPRALRKLVSFRPRNSSSPADYLKELRDLVMKVELPAGAAVTEVQTRGLEALVRDRRPRSVLDIASPGGSGAKLAARAGIQAVFFESDPARVTQVYGEFRAKALVLPLVMDFTKPTPSIGFGGHYSIAASERFACEMVFAYDLVQRLVFERYLNFEQIAEGLAAFAKRWAIVEFTRRASETFPWYSLDGFCGALRKRFRQVDTSGGEGAEATMVFCEK
jgi:hypothetical protein